MPARSLALFLPIAILSTSWAQTQSATTNPSAYPLTQIKLTYTREVKGQPPIDDLLNMEVPLAVRNGVYTAAGNQQPVLTKLRALGTGDVKSIDVTGISAIYEAVIKSFRDRDIVGVMVTVDARDFDVNDRDLRAGRGDLTLQITTTSVQEVRTISIYPDVPQNERLNHARDAYVREGSPIKAEKQGGPSLLNKKVLDAYILQLEKEKGIRVDVAVSGTENPGLVNLDYLLSPKPAATAPTQPARNAP